ncbi:MAG: chitobiase/beta-hexosaminidase C-terminal domain-containing protein [Bacteroidetes bacterium]|nr:chitobiase/beta-hexosaminidase C-terminal domain-containing protein [Bacteroidota bacterium]
MPVDLTKPKPRGVLAISPFFATDQTLFANGGNLKSTDRRTTWTILNLSEPSTFALDKVALSPNFGNDKTIFLSFADGLGNPVGLKKSIDGGITWTSNNLGIKGFQVQSLIISPDYGNDHALFMRSAGSIYGSRDGGAAWSNIGRSLSCLGIKSFTISPNFRVDSTIFASTDHAYPGDFFISKNSGTTWTTPGLTLGILDYAISPFFATDQTIFGLTGGFSTPVNLLKTTNGGTSWSGVTTITIPQTNPVVTIAISPNYNSDQTLFIGTGHTLFKSTDGGSTWLVIDLFWNIGYNHYIKYIGISPNYQADQNVFIGTEGPVLKSVDRGLTWNYSTSGISGFINSPFAFSPNFVSDQTIFLGTGSGLFKTTNGGISWANVGLNDLSSLTISPGYPCDGTLFAGTWSNSVWKYLDTEAMATCKPAIASLSPTFGLPGSSVTITGTKFGISQGTSAVTFNGLSAGSILSWSDTQIIATVPVGANSGPVVVTVNGVSSNGVNFNVTPIVSSITPNSGLIGSSVIIAGSNFGAVQGTSNITFNGINAGAAISWSNTSITATVPSGATTGLVVVTVNGIASNGINFTLADLIPPITSASPIGGVYAASQSIMLTCTDSNSGCATTYYTTDGTIPMTLSPIYTMPILISANSTLKFFSRDKAGNSEAVQTQIYVIDTVAPVTSASPLGGTYLAAQSVTLTCADSNSGCVATYYTTDGTTPTNLSAAYSGPITISSNTTLKYFSKDKAGNSEVVQTQVYTVSTNAPVTTASPLGGTYGSAQIVTLTCTDTNTGCAATYYTTDGTIPTTASPVYIGPITISSNTTLKCFSKSNAGNLEAIQTQVYVIDAVAPTTTASPMGGTYGSAQSVALTCTDSSSGCAATYYSTDGSVPTVASPLYAGPITISSNTTLKFFSRDKVGNSETVKTQVYVIDTVAPTTTASPVGGTYPSAQSVTLTCADTNSGCAATYYTTDGTIPTTLSPVYTSPISISANTTLRYFSKDKAGNSEVIQTQGYTLLPTATTGSVSSVTTSSANLSGVGNANGNIGTGWFEYGTAMAYGTNTIAQTISGSVSTPLHQVINGLLPNTGYHYRFCVQTSGNMVCGVDATFMTRSATLGDSGNISMVIPATETRVDGYDLDDLGRAFGSDRSKANWNALADLNNDGIVDGKDLTILAINFGKAQ